MRRRRLNLCRRREVVRRKRKAGGKGYIVKNYCLDMVMSLNFILYSEKLWMVFE